MAIAEPDFIDRDPAQITSEMIAQYEDASGKKLYPAQAEAEPAQQNSCFVENHLPVSAIEKTLSHPFIAPSVIPFRICFCSSA